MRSYHHHDDRTACIDTLHNWPKLMATTAGKIVELFESDWTDDDEVNGWLGKLHDEVENCSVDEADRIVDELKVLILLPHLPRAAFAALLCLQISQSGSGTATFEKLLIDRLESLLHHAMPIAQQAQEREVESDEELAAIVAVASDEQQEAWEAFDGDFWSAFYTLFAISDSARQAAQPLRPFATTIAAYSARLHWLERVMSVLESNEPLLVIDVANRIGAVGKFSGVPDNFQLNVLLMDGFPGDDRPRVSDAVADNAKGVGPQEVDETVEGVWNLHNWTAIKSGPELDDSNEHWIWNEGRPEDIELFDGYRVVLLGPASYVRTWPANRAFVDMPASIQWDQELTTAQVDQWLQRMIEENSVR